MQLNTNTTLCVLVALAITNPVVLAVALVALAVLAVACVVGVCLASVLFSMLSVVALYEYVKAELQGTHVSGGKAPAVPLPEFPRTAIVASLDRHEPAGGVAQTSDDELVRRCRALGVPATRRWKRETMLERLGQR